MQNKPGRAVVKRRGSMRGRALRSMVGVAMAVTVVAGVIPAHAAGEIKGSVMKNAAFITPTYNVDWAPFAAQQCATWKDGVQVALIDATPFKGKQVTFTITGATQGAIKTQVLTVLAGFYPCLDAGAYTQTWGNLGTLTPTRALVRTISTSAKNIALVGNGGAIGINFKMSWL